MKNPQELRQTSPVIRLSKPPYSKTTLNTYIADVHTLCTKVSCLRYALSKYVKGFKSSEHDELLLTCINNLGKLESYMRQGKMQDALALTGLISLNTQSVIDFLKIKELKAQNFKTQYSLNENEANKYYDLTMILEEINNHFKNGNYLMNLQNVLQHGNQNQKKNDNDNSWIGSNNNIIDTLCNKLFNKTPANMDKDDKALLQYILVAAETCIDDREELYGVYKTIKDGPQSIASCHPTAEGLLTFFGIQDTKVCAGGFGQEAINDAVDIVKLALIAKENTIMTIKAQGLDDGHSYTLIKCGDGEKVQVIESWGGRNVILPDTDVISVYQHRNAKTAFGKLLAKFSFSPPKELTIAEAVYFIDLLKSPDPAVRHKGHAGLSLCYQGMQEKYELQLNLAGKAVKDQITQSTHSLITSTAVIKPKEEVLHSMEQAIQKVRDIYVREQADSQQQKN